MRIMVSADSALARYAGLLAAVPGRARQAFAQGLNEGGDLERTKIRRVLRTQTGVKAAGSITRRTRARRAYAGHLEYNLDGTGKGMPIKEFPVRASVGAHVTATPWGVSHDFGARSFKSSRRGLLRRRVGRARMPIEGFNGPAVSKEIVKDASAAEWQANAAPTVARIVVKRLGRLLP